jgi:hypothetical protein
MHNRVGLILSSTTRPICWILPRSLPGIRRDSIHGAANSQPLAPAATVDTVKVGESIRARDVLGLVGHSGVTAPHLHFQVNDGPGRCPAQAFPAHLIRSCATGNNVAGEMSFDYVVKLQRHVRDLAANPAEWMPWNYRRDVGTAWNRMNPHGRKGSTATNGCREVAAVIRPVARGKRRFCAVDLAAIRVGEAVPNGLAMNLSLPTKQGRPFESAWP